MDITLQTTVPCVICGYQLTAYRFAAVKVNKRSMRGKTYLACGPGPCPECGTRTHEPAPDGTYRIIPQDLERIRAYRLKRWPELEGEAA